MTGHAYHNTTNVSGDQLARYQDKALSQDQRLLAYFELVYNSGGGYLLLTPSVAKALVFGDKIPITSVRRALSNLTREGDLVKTGKRAKGPYGRPEFCWSLAPKHQQKDLFK